jgi:hypothetical protein
LELERFILAAVVIVRVIAGLGSDVELPEERCRISIIIAKSYTYLFLLSAPPPLPASKARSRLRLRRLTMRMKQRLWRVACGV